MDKLTDLKITVRTIVNAPVEKVWECWTEPGHIINWNHASDDWHTTFAENDLKVGGKFHSRMEAKDGRFGFDFDGVYDKVKFHQNIAYTLGDGRKVQITFIGKEYITEIIEVFEAENTVSIEQQQQGWQAILDNFKHIRKNSNKKTILNEAYVIEMKTLNEGGKNCAKDNSTFMA